MLLGRCQNRMTKLCVERMLRGDPPVDILPTLEGKRGKEQRKTDRGKEEGKEAASHGIHPPVSVIDHQQRGETARSCI